MTVREFGGTVTVTAVKTLPVGDHAPTALVYTATVVASCAKLLSAVLHAAELEVKGCGVVQSLSSDRLAVDETLISQSCEQNRERRGGGSISLSRGSN